MLKRRLIAVILVRQGIVVQSIGFSKYLPVGKPEIAAEFFSEWGADEIILLDISATIEQREPDLKMVEKVAKACRVPLTVGGGIRVLSEAQNLVRCGADKIIFNQAGLKDPELLSETAKTLGSQCVVGAIDSIYVHGSYKVYDYTKKKPIEQSPQNLAKNFERYGCGEIFVTSVDRDGKKNGFDLSLTNLICSNVKTPVISCGGAGKPGHFADLFTKTKAHGMAAANFFHFTEHSITISKACLYQGHKIIRHDSLANYKKKKFDHSGRVLKESEKKLDDMLFTKIKKEII